MRLDYMKVDGCGGPAYYDDGYKAMGAALQVRADPPPLTAFLTFISRQIILYILK